MGNSRRSAGSIIAELRKYGNPADVAGMARFGINSHNTLGVKIPVLRKLAKQTGKDHALALALWKSGIHEARILASMIDAPSLLTAAQMNEWTAQFDSWDVCDQVCMNLFRESELAYRKAKEWSGDEREFVKRAGFALMAALAVGNKKASDREFEPFFELIAREASDERNYVKKAVNWALRQIGKRNVELREKAIALSEALVQRPSPAARWIGRDALRELTSRR